MYLIFDMEQDKKIDNDSMVKMTEYNGEKKLKITKTLNTQNNFVNIKRLPTYKICKSHRRDRRTLFTHV